MGEIGKIKKSIDIIRRKKTSSAYQGNKHPVFFVPENTLNKPVLFVKGRRVENFFTEDSKLYITPKESGMISKGVPLDRKLRKWDSVSSKIVSEYRNHNVQENDFLYNKFKEKYDSLQQDVESVSKNIVDQFSVARLWNLSIIGSILFGMFSMTMIYRYLGQGASAGEVASRALSDSQTAIERVAGEYDQKLDQEGDLYTQQFIREAIDEKKVDLNKEISDMVKGYPIEEMVPYIAEKDRIVAAFIIGIAKKESNWGKRIPVLNGQDCYNYWGYRGIRKLMGTGGHTCFNSRKDAVDTVAKRIQWLIENKELNTPEKMVIWKCGSNCNVTGGWAAANKWIADVNMYFKKLNTE